MKKVIIFENRKFDQVKLISLETIILNELSILKSFQIKYSNVILIKYDSKYDESKFSKSGKMTRRAGDSTLVLCYLVE